MMATHATESANARTRAKRVFRFIESATDRGILRDVVMVVEYGRDAWMHLRCEKWIVALLLRDRCQRPVPACEHRVPREREELLDIVPVLVREVGRASADRAREHGVADDGEGVAEPGDIERGLSGRMPPRR